ncbi:hypothetical protein [Bartonella tribocorum]|nr:hypothetical protein [Bartonella tribocorum]
MTQAFDGALKYKLGMICTRVYFKSLYNIVSMGDKGTIGNSFI